MSTYDIPLSNENQQFNIQLAGKVYRFRIFWNSSSNCWVLDIANTRGSPLVNGIPLVAGVDLLSPYPEFKFGGQLIAFTDNEPNLAPTFANLGMTGHLHFITP